MNTCTIGICCIDNPGWATEGVELAPDAVMQSKRKYLTARQLEALTDWLAENCRKYGLDSLGQFTRGDGRTVGVTSQHSDHDAGKPFCASLVLPPVRQLVSAKM